MNAGASTAGFAADDRSGRRDRLARLFDDYFDDVYRFCLARSGDPSVAGDVASEAFVAAARAFATDRGGQVDLPWLFVTARRRLFDHWRSDRRHQRRVERLTELREVQAETVGASDDVDSELVLLALSSLPDRQRAAVALRYLDDFSVSEVADALDLEYRAAESLLARGRRAFSKAWKELS